MLLIFLSSWLEEEGAERKRKKKALKKSYHLAGKDVLIGTQQYFNVLSVVVQAVASLATSSLLVVNNEGGGEKRLPCGIGFLDIVVDG